MSVENLSHNFSIIVTEVGGVVVVQDDYDRVLTDLWVGVTLSSMIVCCVGILCFCFLYHKFQQWKFQVLESRVQERQNSEASYDPESLPSYTLVTGLPSYDEAMEQLKQVQNKTGKVVEPTAVVEIEQPMTSTIMLSNLSVTELLQLYRPPNFK